MRRLSVLLSFMLLLPLSDASASTIVYTDLASFQAASTTTLIDFSGIALPGDITWFSTNPLTIGGVTFSGSDMYVIDDTALCCHIPGFNSLFDGNGAAGSALNASFGPAVTAAGFDVLNSCDGGACSSHSGTVTITLSNGFFYSLDSSLQSFFGFVSDDNITSVNITTSGNVSGQNHAEVSNFRYGDAEVAAVPEPSTLLLLGGGLVLVARRIRRRSA